MNARAGTTLIELMIAIVILSVMAGVAVVALRTAGPPSDQDVAFARVQQLRRTVVENGRPLSIGIELSGRRYTISAYPDGRVVTDAPLPVDRLSGRGVDVGR
jgi:prepilin-type N-terminal cleavage/methylation domain-containing protein